MAKRSFFRDNGLSFVLVALFALFTAGLALSGWHEYNEKQVRHGAQIVSMAAYLRSPDFGEAVFENWESEFLQMGFMSS
jgi:hypothetical protein